MTTPRIAYVEAREDETKDTAVEVLRNAVAWFTARGIRVERVLTDNGGCYRSHLWHDTCTELGITHKRPRPYRPQTNGKIERSHRALADGWALKKFYPLRNRPPRGPSRPGPHLQAPQTPPRARETTTDHKTEQRAWTSHLEGKHLTSGSSLLSTPAPDSRAGQQFSPVLARTLSAPPRIIVMIESTLRASAATPTMPTEGPRINVESLLAHQAWLDSPPPRDKALRSSSSRVFFGLPRHRHVEQDDTSVLPSHDPYISPAWLTDK